MDNGKYKLRASFTVEAAYVCPLMFFLIFTVLWMAFTLHDRLAADAWSAEAAEEARMALQYGKIPYSDNIYVEGFNDKEGKEILSLLAADRETLGERCMSNSKMSVSTGLDGQSLTVGVDIEGRKAFGMLSGVLFKDVYLENRGERANYGSFCRLTTLVFRFGKKLLNV